MNSTQSLSVSYTKDGLWRILTLQEDVSTIWLIRSSNYVHQIGKKKKLYCMCQQEYKAGNLMF